MKLRQNATKEEKAAYNKWYHKDRLKRDPNYRILLRKANRLKRKKKQLWWHEFKKQFKCSRCPENDSACLDFHHLNPKDKQYTLGTAVTNLGLSEAKVWEEISKCEVLCANCHRKEHRYGKP